MPLLRTMWDTFRPPALFPLLRTSGSSTKRRPLKTPQSEFWTALATVLAFAAALLTSMATAAPASADQQVYDACQRLSAGQVRFATYGANRVTFATAVGRNSHSVIITGCVRSGSGYGQKWQTTGFSGDDGFARQNLEWESTGRSPTGSFSFTEALGRRNPGTTLKYHTVNYWSRWGGERTPNYNNYFEGRGGPIDENLWTYMNLGYYEQAAVINWNRKPDMSTVRGASFAIFFHAGNAPSNGCISTNLSTVTRLLRTNRPGDRIVMGSTADVFSASGRSGDDTTAGKSIASVKSGSDVLAVAPSGVLWNYPAAGNGTLYPRVAIGSGWHGAVSVNVVDWDRDGIYDLLAQWQNGTLTVYPGRATGGFSPSFRVGNGWQKMTINVGRWDNTKRYRESSPRTRTGGCGYTRT